MVYTSFSIVGKAGAVGVGLRGWSCGLELWAESPAVAFTLRTFPGKLCLFHLSCCIGFSTEGRSLAL